MSQTSAGRETARPVGRHTFRPLSDDSAHAAPAVPSPGIGPRTKFARNALRVGWNLLPPLTFVGIVFLWSWSVSFFRIPTYLLPGPGAVFGRIISDAAMLWDNAMITMAEIVVGFGLTLLTAIPLGLVIALSRWANQILYPPIMLLQLVPKIAVAPLFLVWLGFGMESKVLLTVLMTFFPLLIA